ncbi:C6 zinc finger domain containing protein [Colletotrichum higginsianum]|nr:C6 zinc finger domain containing protein [Colletotrichum higginsianum]
MVSSYWEQMDLWVPGTDATGSKNLTWEQLDFNRNCSYWGHWLSAMLQTDSWDPKTTIGMSVESAMEYYATAMPKGYTTTFDEVAKWFAYNIKRFNDTVLYGPKPHCPTEFCKAVGYTGNQDLCGIGVVVSYYLEGILATMYLLAFTVHQMRRHLDKNVYEKPRPTQKQGAGERILDAFRGSLDIFLGGAMLISVAMLGASVYASATNFKERSESNPDLPTSDSIYEMALALIASNFSVFPVMLLYALAKHDGHRKWLHRSVLLLLWGLSVTVVYLAPRGEVDYALRKSGHRNFECDQRGSQYWKAVKATQFLVVGLPLMWLVLTIFLTTGFKIPGMVDRPWVKRWRSMWRLSVAWVNMLIMWAILAYFTQFRQKIIDAAGGLDKNDKWTFGQVLALAAWVPIVVEILYILVCK